MMRGAQVNLGPMALLRISGSNVRIIVSKSRFQALDQAVLRHLGVEPASEQIIVLKSTVHFRGDFDSISGLTLLVESPGNNPCRTEQILYRNLRPGVRLSPGGPSFHSPPKRKADEELIAETPAFAVVETIEW